MPDAQPAPPRGGREGSTQAQPPPRSDTHRGVGPVGVIKGEALGGILGLLGVGNACEGERRGAPLTTSATASPPQWRRQRHWEEAAAFNAPEGLPGYPASTAPPHGPCLGGSVAAPGRLTGKAGGGGTGLGQDTRGGCGEVCQLPPSPEWALPASLAQTQHAEGWNQTTFLTAAKPDARGDRRARWDLKT